MPSIFSPRVEASKDGVIKLKEFKNDKVWDKYYFDPVIKKVCKKIGEGEEDFVIEEKLTFTKKSIKDVIDSQVNDVVNIDDSLKRFVETGDLTALPPGLNDGELIDYTKFPEDHAAYMSLMNKVAAEYDALDPSLKKNMTLSEFIKTVDEGKLKAYFDSIKPQEEVKKEDK